MVLDQLQILNRDFEIEILEIDRLIPLKNNWKELLQELKNFGKVTVTTYNDSAYIKKTGIYDELSFNGPVGQALTHEIDLRLFLMHWHYGVIALTNTLDLYFFDKSGSLVHQISILEPNKAMIDSLSKYFSDDVIDKISFENYKIESEKNDEEIDKQGLQSDWKNLKDTHEFFQMLKKFNVSRTQALRLGSAEFVIEISKDSIYKLLKNAIDQEVSIMAFVGSRGCIQIHTDPINVLIQRGSFLILDEQNLYLSLNTDNFKSCYIVKKPTIDGIVTSVEVFDDKDEMIVQFFGERKPGTQESESWRNLLCTILISSSIC